MDESKLKMLGMKLRHWGWLWLYFLFFVFIVLLINLIHPLSLEMLIMILTVGCGAFYFFHQHHLESARFFKELVTEFNRRYDDKNDNLLQVLESKEAFDSKQKQALIDYFNLCAEEYMFYEAGYIYERVWRAWHNGMKQFGRDKRVAELWKQEFKTDSYYGFEFPIDDQSQER